MQVFLCLLFFCFLVLLFGIFCTYKQPIIIYPENDVRRERKNYE